MDDVFLKVFLGGRIPYGSHVQELRGTSLRGGSGGYGVPISGVPSRWRWRGKRIMRERVEEGAEIGKVLVGIQM